MISKSKYKCDWCLASIQTSKEARLEELPGKQFCSRHCADNFLINQLMRSNSGPIKPVNREQLRASKKQDA